MQHGYTLTELLTVVAILGILSMVGVPQYQGYVENSKSTSAQNNLRSIYMQQQNYYLDNNAYYISGASCGNGASIINTNLFDAKEIIPASSEGFTYCITQATVDDFTAQAVNTATSAAFTINNNNVVNF